jgi:SMI1-KNR4 cell-wall
MIETIEKVIEARVLIESLMLVPDKGATSDEIKQEELLIGVTFSKYYKSFLERWNGIDLDIIRIYGCGDSLNRIRRISNEQTEELALQKLIVFGSDPSGFIYVENEKGEIFSFDSDGGELEFLSKNLNIFFADLVFGKDSNRFMGDDWKKELLEKGVI